jgi:hypothetical protein
VIEAALIALLDELGALRSKTLALLGQASAGGQTGARGAVRLHDLRIRLSTGADGGQLTA